MSHVNIVQFLFFEMIVTSLFIIYLHIAAFTAISSDVNLGDTALAVQLVSFFIRVVYIVIMSEVTRLIKTLKYGTSKRLSRLMKLLEEMEQA